MAIDDGDPALRAAANSARAQNRNIRIVGAPSADEIASPWSRPPIPESAAKQAIIERANGGQPLEPKPAKRREPRVPNVEGETPEKQRVIASRLIGRLLEDWYKEAPKHLTRADSTLAYQLMRNGSALIDCGYPIDTLSSLNALAHKLLLGSMEDDSGNEELERIHKLMSREDEPAGDDNGD